MRNDIKALIVFELNNPEAIDVSQTAIAAEAHVRKNGISEITTWQDSESVAMLVLDWLSMHEPVWKMS